MKKCIFAVAVLVAMTSCDWFGHKNVEKCNSVDELQTAVTESSTDTARFDLNGDGNVDSLDIEFLKSKDQVNPEQDATANPEQENPSGGETEAPAEEPAK